MMYSDPTSIQASALSREQSGLGLSAEETGASAINISSAYLKSDGDALQLFDGIFKFISTASLSLPPPFNAIASLLSYLGGSSLSVVRKFLERSATNCAKYLPVPIAEKVVGKFKSSWFTYGSDAAKDKLVQESKSNTALRLVLEGANLVSDTDLNLKVSTRLANRIYKSARSFGATQQDAAMVAWSIAKDAGASQSVLNNYANMVGADNNFERTNPTLVWSKGKKKVSSKQAKDAGATGSDGDTGLLLAAGGLGVLYLLLRANRAKD